MSAFTHKMLGKEGFYMFYGQYSHNLDAKKRMSLPSKFREELGQSVVITRNVDKCLSLYSRERWDEFASKVETLPQTEARIIRRFLFSSADELTVDGQGRVLINDELCKYASLTRAVKIIGVGDHLEIWDGDKWAAETSEENTAELTDLLIKLGF